MKTIDAIRIRIRHTDVKSEKFENSSPRENFWAPVRKNNNYAERSISSLETGLIREFGDHLRAALVQRISQGIRDAEDTLYGPELRMMLEHYRHFFHEFPFPKEKYWPSFYPNEPLTKLIEFRQQVFREIPAARTVFERLALTSDVTFSVRIDGYSSLDLSLLVGQIEKLAAVFDSDFESFRVFLDVFVPKAFGDVFVDDIANEMSFEINIPQSIKDVFVQPNVTNPPIVEPTKPPVLGTEAAKSNAEQRAQWLWKLANGSLLIPVLIALAVMYFGLKEIASIRILQYEALKPILEHQVQLLKEDRERLCLNIMSNNVTTEKSKDNTRDLQKCPFVMPKSDSNSADANGKQKQ
jgi:hypothetical protein